MVLFDSWVGVARDLHKTLHPTRGADGEQQYARGLELLEQRWRNLLRSGTDMDRIVGSALSVALESIAHVQFESTRIDQPLLAVTANVLARPVNKIGNVVNPAELGS